MPKSLLLKPELSTLRECSWQKKEAMVMADAHNPDVDGNPVLPYSPRQILKKVASQTQIKDITT